MSSDSNQDAPLVSVILPIYNGGKYLSEAINSILAQTYQNFELILIDDGSTDSSLQLIKQYQACDSRVQVITQPNKGLATTLNYAVDQARGKWIARMDQDDISLPNRFERQLECLDKTGADICGTLIQNFGTDDKRIMRSYHSDEAIKMDMLFKSPLAHPTVMMSASFAKKYRYRKEFDMAEDYDLWVRAARAGFKFANVPEVLLLYRIHSHQTSTVRLEGQRALTRKIQKSYWTFMMSKVGLNYDGADYIDLDEGNSDMNVFSNILERLASESKDEALKAVLENGSWFYLKAVTNNPSVISKLKNLYKKSGLELDTRTLMRLRVLKLFNIHIGSIQYKIIKKLYFKIYYGLFL